MVFFCIFEKLTFFHLERGADLGRSRLVNVSGENKGENVLLSAKDPIYGFLVL